MAPSKDQVQQLIIARTTSYSSAFENLDLKAVKAWHSTDIVFNDIALDEYKMDGPKCQTLLGEAFGAMHSLKVIESSTTGTADFTTWEQLIEVVYGIDEPRMGIEKGKKATIRGVSILWWRWEGGGAWHGEADGDALRGWKIVREHDYMVTLKDGAEGGKVKMFS